MKNKLNSTFIVSEVSDATSEASTVYPADNCCLVYKVPNFSNDGKKVCLPYGSTRYEVYLSDWDRHEDMFSWRSAARTLSTIFATIMIGTAMDKTGRAAPITFKIDKWATTTKLRGWFSILLMRPCLEVSPNSEIKTARTVQATWLDDQIITR